MAIEAKITLNTQQYQKELDNVKNKTKKTTAEASLSVNSVGSSFSQVGGVVSSFGGQIGQTFGAIGQTISAAVSGWGAAIAAAVVAIIALIKEVWDAFTVSEEEAAAALAEHAKILQLQGQAEERLQKQNEKYMSRLNELNKRENLSNVEKKETLHLVELLNKSYGDLGIQIDNTTGKISGLDAAQSKMLKNNIQKNIKNLSSQLKIFEEQNKKAIENYADETVNDLRWDASKIEGIVVDRLSRYTPEALQKELPNLLAKSTDESEIEALGKLSENTAKIIEYKQRIDELKQQLIQIDFQEEENKSKKSEKKENTTEKIDRKNIENAMSFTNSLTQRGGFATGGKVESLNDINRRIATSSATMAATLMQINNKMDNVDKVSL